MTFKTTSLLAASLFTATQIMGAFVLVEDFEMATLNIAYPGSEVASGTMPSVRADVPEFGGTGNKYLQIIDNDGGSGGGGFNNGLFDFSDGNLASYSMDFYAPGAHGIIALSTSSPWTANRFVSTGAFGSTVTANTVYKMTLLINRSGAAADYFNPVTSATTSLADNSVALFFHDGTNYLSQTSGSAGDLTKPSPSRLWIYKSDGNPKLEVLIDNIAVSNSLMVAVIPEPSSLILIGLSIGAFFLIRRRVK